MLCRPVLACLAGLLAHPCRALAEPLRCPLLTVLLARVGDSLSRGVDTVRMTCAQWLQHRGAGSWFTVWGDDMADDLRGNVECEDGCGYSATNVRVYWNGAEFGYECPECPAVAVLVTA